MAVGAGVFGVAGLPLGAAVGVVVKISAPGEVFVLVSDGAGVTLLLLLLLPLVAVVPQPHTTKKSWSVIISNKPFPSASPVQLSRQQSYRTVVSREGTAPTTTRGRV